MGEIKIDMKKSSMKYIFLVNRFSLRENTDNVIKKIEEVAKEKKFNYVIEVNSDSLSTEDIIKKYKKEEVTIIVLGGDGTINRALNAIVGSKSILGYIPCGTGNDFYRTNKELLKPGINEIDLIKINNKYFINVTCFGIDADIGNTGDLKPGIIPRSQRYNIAIAKHFFKYKPRHMKVLVNNKEYEDKYTTITICNGKYYGKGFKMAPRAKLDDGLLDAYLIEKMPKLKMAFYILRMKKGKHENSKHTKIIRTDKMKIICNNEVTCNMDGDMLTAKEFDLKVVPKGIKMYFDQELIDKIKVKRK